MKTRLVIGLDCLFADPKRVFGMWIHVVNLLQNLAELDSSTDYVVFLNRAAVSDFPVRAPNVRVVSSRVAAWSVNSRIAFQNAALPWLARWYRLDLLHSTGNYGPMLPGVRSVLTVHDLLAFFDADHFPDHSRRRRAAGLDFLMGQSIRRAQRILVDSEHTKREVLQRYPGAGSRVQVVYPGLPAHVARRSATDSQRLCAAYGIRRPYILALGLHPPHKNIGRLIRAFAMAKRAGSLSCCLVLAGEAGPSKGALVRSASEEGVGHDVVFTGNVAAEDLNGLYRFADAFVFPSLMEGFGFPVLEAMANGTPVACSNAGPLPEVVGDAALAIHPENVEEMSRAICRILEDSSLRAELIARGRERVKLFSYRTAAEKTRQLYQELLDRPRLATESVSSHQLRF